MRAAVLVLFGAGGSVAVSAQNVPAGTRPDGSRASTCDPREDASGERQYRGFACERRTIVLGPRAAVRVDAGPNGGIVVRANASGALAAHDSITIVATVTAYGQTDADAARLASAVALADDGGTFRARGPARRYDGHGRDPWWSVEWRADVPRHTDLELRAVNGAVRVAGVAGRLRLETENGGVEVDSVAGQVRGRAANGGVAATLAGAAWDAAGLADGGLDLVSDNGGAVLRFPAAYSARVSVGSVSGPLAVDYPVDAGPRGGDQLDVTLGAGGAPVRVLSRNGGARLSMAR